jgi:hypothetical protein
MKKLALLFSAVLFTAWSSNVLGQNTGIEPSIGSTHTYYVNSTDGTSQDLGDVNNTFIWWVSTNTADLTDALSAGTEFSVASGTYGGSGAVNNFKIELTWNPAAASGTYYLVVQEFDTDGTACSNMKAVAIQPANAFELTFVALDASDADADDPSRCAPDIAISATGTTINYDYGVGDYIFRLNATGLYTDWSFDPDFSASSLGNGAPTYEYQVGGTAGAWTTISGTTISVPANTSGSEVVYVRAQIDNGDTGGTFEEGTSAQTISLTLSNVEDAGSNAVTKISNAAAADITATPVQTQTVKARPATSTIGYN